MNGPDRAPGAEYLGGDRSAFRVWAPEAASLQVHLPDSGRLVPLSRCGRGYWEGEAAGVPPGSRYRYRLDGRGDLADPASHFQPQGPSGPSEVVDHSFPWSDAGFRAPPLPEWVVYELHTGTFTAEGTFEAVIPRLAELADLGVTALELMPVAQFPGRRNWGYDGVFPFAVQWSYGGPAGLKRLVNACHRQGLAVVLDVVYNHLGPEGNVLPRFGPYFTGRYRTPWGEALNFDGPGSDQVRSYFIANALHWLERYHLDALRLDAVHAVFDMSAHPFLLELAEGVAAWNRAHEAERLLIAESDLNDPRLLRGPERGGYGLDAQWSDDFHHALHALLTGERQGYYADFGAPAHLAAAYTNPYVYNGQYSRFRRRRHGSPAGDLAPFRFLVCSQNHDQVGNRMLGERLGTLLDFETAKVAAAALLLAPRVPVLFMGEEYGEPAPFLYFVDHQDGELLKAVREGRRREFRQFAWQGEPPDPGSEGTFHRSILRWELRLEGRHAALRELYRELLALRRREPALERSLQTGAAAGVSPDGRIVRLEHGGGELVALFNVAGQPGDAGLSGAGGWDRVLDTAGERWLGPGSRLPESLPAGEPLRLPGRSAVLLRRRKR